MISQSIRAPWFSPARVLGLKLPVEDQAQLGIFWNYANLYQVHPIPDLPDRVDLASAGFDFHYQTGRFTDVQFDMGWQLRNAPQAAKRGGAVTMEMIGFHMM